MVEKIIFKNFNFNYEGNKNDSISNISLTIAQGEVVVLCGESGCGKSTILKCINGLIPEFYKGRYSGELCINGRSIDENLPEIAGQTIASVFQDSRSQFFTMNSTNEVAFGCENYGIEHEEMIKRVDRAFHYSKIENLKDRSVFELSSGERQKVAFAGASTLAPKVYVLDEPSANLDIQSIYQLKNMLQDLKAEGASIILAEHRLFYLIELVDRFIYMKQGKIVEEYTPNDMATMDLKDLQDKMLRAPSSNQIEYCMEKQTRMLHDIPALCIENLKAEYKKGYPILKGISFESSLKQTWCVIGKNGCGKTTLGMTLAGMLKYKEGGVQIYGKKHGAKNIVKEVFFVMQEAEHQLYTESVYKELLFGMGKDENVKAKAKKILKKLGLYELKDAHPFALSGGQMQRITIALAYMSSKLIIVLDEPTSGLDYKNMNLIAEIINEMRENGKIIFIISHDLEFLARTATSCIRIENGVVAQNFTVQNKEDFMRIKDYMLKELIPNYA